MHSYHPSMRPGAIIGYRKNGQPIHLIAGGSGEDGDSGTATGTPDGTGTKEDQPAASDSGSSSDTAGSTDNSVQDTGSHDGDRSPARDDDKTARTIAAIREDFKGERAKRQAAEQKVADIQAALDADKAERAKQMDALAVALGIKQSDEPPDPKKLAEELKAAQDKAATEISQRDTNLRQAQVELAVLRNAGKHGGNGDALLDSRAFMAKVSGLDPAAGDFTEQLADAIQSAVDSSPQYKAVTPKADDKGGNGTRQPPAPSRSGGEHTTPGGNRQWTVEDVRAAAARNPAEVAKAIDDGLLVDLGYQPSKRRR
jgi:hypothetical protein